MNQHLIEPELTRLPPRTIRKRPKHSKRLSWGDLVVQFLLWSVILISVGLTLWGLHMILVRVSGPTFPCQITDKYRKQDDEGRWFHYLVYRARVNGREFTTSEVVDPDSYAKMTPGSTLQLQTSPLWPGMDSTLLVPGRGVWEIVVMTMVFSALMLGLSGFIIWQMMLMPRRKGKLVKSGVAVSGRLTKKVFSSPDPKVNSYLYYEYIPLTADPVAPPLTGRDITQHMDWYQIEVGNPVTVIYDAKNPAFHVLYRNGDYEAVL